MFPQYNGSKLKSVTKGYTQTNFMIAKLLMQVTRQEINLKQHKLNNNRATTY